MQETSNQQESLSEQSKAMLFALRQNGSLSSNINTSMITVLPLYWSKPA